MNDYILVELTNSDTAIITFNRPSARNALTVDAMFQFADAVNQLAAMDTLRAVILTGAGTQAFCSGGDIKDLSEMKTADDGLRVGQIMSSALLTLESLPVPVIAAMNGYALGGGSEIALACDIRIVDEAIQFGMVHRNMGLIPGWGGGQRLMRAVGYSRAMEMLLTGEIMDAAGMKQLGLANRVVSKGTALQHTADFIDDFAMVSLKVVRAIKQALHAGLHVTYDEALASERTPFPDLWADPIHLNAVRNFLKRKS